MTVPSPEVPPPSDSAGKLAATEAIGTAREYFRTLTGKEPDGVTGVRETGEGGWSVLIDVVELDRIPATTSILATYRVDVDAHGELRSCERLRRFTRGSTDF